MDSLIAELEAAAEGNRELDYAIAKEMGWQFSGEHTFKEHGFFWRDATTDEWKQLPRWSTSLDAALTLVPEGFVWRVSTDFGPIAWAAVSGHKGIFWADTKSEALTAALALCIAALKARQAMEAAV